MAMKVSKTLKVMSCVACPERHKSRLLPVCYRSVCLSGCLSCFAGQCNHVYIIWFVCLHVCLYVLLTQM